MMKFKMEIRPTEPDTMMVHLNASDEEWNQYIGTVYGSANVLMARLFDLPFADFLRMCRDTYGADLYGDSGYTYPVWRKGTKYVEFLTELNHRLNLVLKNLQNK